MIISKIYIVNDLVDVAALSCETCAMLLGAFTVGFAFASLSSVHLPLTFEIFQPSTSKGEAKKDILKL